MREKRERDFPIWSSIYKREREGREHFSSLCLLVLFIGHSYMYTYMLHVHGCIIFHMHT